MKLYGNGRIATLNEEKPYIENGAIAVSEGIILGTGDSNTLREKYSHAEFVNLNNRLVIPGLINTHMHLYSTFARGLTFGVSPRTFLQILENIWWKLDLFLTNREEIYYSALVPIIEGLRAGTTSIIDHHASFGYIDGSLDIIEEAILKAGIRGVLTYEVSDRWGEEKKKSSINENIRYIKKKKDENFISALFGLHASMTLSNRTLEECVSSVEGLDIGFHIHVAEGQEDVEDSLSKYNMRVIERLNSFGILGEKTIAVHCIHINRKEIDLLSQSKTNVIHNPESNMNNAVGVAPILEMNDANVLLGLGTDGYTPSMFESVKVAYILPKLHYKDPQAGSMLAYKMLFENNRKILGKYFRKEIGILKEGAFADFIALDYYPPTTLNDKNIFFHLIFGMRENMINDVIINGNHVIKNKEFTSIDEKEIMAKSREVSKKFWEKFS